MGKIIRVGEICFDSYKDKDDDIRIPVPIVF